MKQRLVREGFIVKRLANFYQLSKDVTEVKVRKVREEELYIFYVMITHNRDTDRLREKKKRERYGEGEKEK